MKAVVFSGTTEGRELSRALAELGAAVTVCVASAYGEEEQGKTPGITVHTGPLSPEGKQTILRDAALCVDATHPYARHISASVREACEKAGIQRLRLLRAQSETEGFRSFPSAEEAAQWLAGREGNILLTTGTRELEAFRGISPEKLYPRVLPSHRSLEACEALGIPHRNILALQGPFSREMNAAMLRQYRIRYLVTKDGGEPGGFREKAEAAKEMGVEVILISRPEETGLSYDEVLDMCRTLLEESGDKKRKNRGEEL